MVAQVTGLKPGEFVHTLRRRASLSQSHRAGAAAIVARAARAADHEAQSGGEGHVRLPLRGLRARRLRAASAHQGRGGGVSAAPPPAPAIVLVAAVGENGVIGRDNALAVAAELRPAAFQGAHHRQAGRDGPQDLSVDRQAAAGSHQHRGHARSQFRAAGVVVANSIDAALDAARDDARERGVDAIMVIGGTDIFAADHAPCRPPGDHPCACAAGGRHAISRRSMQGCGARWRAANMRRAARRCCVQLRHVPARLMVATRKDQRVQHVERDRSAL